MNNRELFQAALGLSEPWRVVRSEFVADEHRLDLYLDFARGARFPCPEGDEGSCGVHDTTDKTWRHLDFFQHQAYLHARLPRVECPRHGVRQVAVPWARPGAGFTLLFEALLMALLAQMPVRSVAALVGEHDTRLWRVLHHYVDEARAAQSMAEVRSVGVDETSARRGQDYISLFADLDTHAVVFATKGRESSVLGEFATDLVAHGGDPAQITNLCCDMSNAYIQGAAEHLPDAEITFDRYHVAQMLTKAVDEVRRQEASSRRSLLKDTRYLWLKNPKNLTAKQAAKLEYLLTKQDILYTVRAYRWRLQFDAYFDQPPEVAEAYLEQWCRGVARSGLLPFKGVVRTVRQHWEGILRWHTTRISNGILEGINSLVQAAKRRARGYRTTDNLIAMTYLIAGKLDLSPTHTK